MIKRAHAYFTACAVVVLVTALAAEPFRIRQAYADIKGTNASIAGGEFPPAMTDLLLRNVSFYPLQQKSNFLPTTSSEASATPPVDPLIAISALQRAAGTQKPIVIATAEAASAAVVHNAGALITVPRDQAGPARFFTINQVLARQHQAKSEAVHLAAIDPKTVTDAATPTVALTGTDSEPFGLFTFRAPDGELWIKWRKVESDIKAEAPTLARCRADGTQCTLATYRFIAIIKAAEAKRGRARLDEVNRRVNEAIRYTSDIAQWAMPDLWSAPLDVDGKGSFDTGKGDCEDYAIAKYVALREAGVPERDLRILLVRDRVVNMGHAVLAARDDGRWLIMDNRFDRMLAENEANFLLPLFAVDTEGIRLFAKPYAQQDRGEQGITVGAARSSSPAAQAADYTPINPDVATK